jgi:hypothetical protein
MLLIEIREGRIFFGWGRTGLWTVTLQEISDECVRNYARELSA